MKKIKSLSSKDVVQNTSDNYINHFLYMYRKVQREYIQKMATLDVYEEDDMRKEAKIQFLVKIINISSIPMIRGISKDTIAQIEEIRAIGAIAHPDVRKHISDAICHTIESFIQSMTLKYPNTFGAYYKQCDICKDSNRIPYTVEIAAMDLVAYDIHFYQSIRNKEYTAQEKNILMKNYEKTKQTMLDVFEADGLNANELCLENHKIVIDLVMHNPAYKKYFANMYGDDCINLNEIKQLSIVVQRNGSPVNGYLYMIPQTGLHYERNQASFTNTISVRPIHTPNYYEDNLYMLFKDSFKKIEQATKQQIKLNGEAQKCFIKSKELKMLMEEDGYSTEEIAEIFKSCENKCRLYEQI